MELNKEIFDLLKIKPNNYSLYIEALTHQSYSNENNLKYNYERLEFLGDAIIKKVVVEYLYHNKQHYQEGKMSEIVSLIVCAATETKAGVDLKLAEHIKIGRSLINSKNFKIESIIEDVYEALVGAIYLDLGEKEAKNFIKETIIKLYESGSLKDSQDYKSLLQEAMMKYGKKDINYSVKKNKDDDGNFMYDVKVYINGICYGSGEALNKKEAEKIAAKKAYNKCVK